MGETLRLDAVAAESFREPLTQSGWLSGPVEAACMIRQGHSPSMASAIVGVGLFKMLGARPAKSLPRKFVLAVTRERVVALKAGAHSEGEGTSATYKVRIERDEIGSWSRGEVSMAPAKDGITSNATLRVGGTEIPCAVPDSDAEPAFAELLQALGGG